MKEPLRRGVVYFSFLLLSMGVAQWVEAQEYPTKPVTLVVPFGPGGESDLIGRALSSVAVEYLGQPILIQLKPGGLGIIGTELVAKSAPDGYTLLSAGDGWSTSLPAIEGRSKGPDDMEAVCRITYNASVMCTHPNAPFKTFKEMMAWIRANPGKLLAGLGGPYSPSQMIWVKLMKQTGVSVRMVSFDGAGQSLLAGLGGNVDIVAGTPQMMLPHIKSKKLVPLVFFDKQRSPDFPEVPTLAEEGLNIVVMQWRGITAPKGTPRPIITKLGTSFKKMTEDESIKALMQKTGLSVNYLGPEEFSKFWRADYESCKELKSLFGK
jgi:tripartite-type tricarboxylate transporter receptor subunit TctC